MSFLNDHEVVVITGASAGVGRATAHRFAKSKARVALIARGEESLKEAAREVEELGGEAIILPLDVSDHKSVFAAAEKVMEKWGRIDVWINDAMQSVFAPVQEITPEEFKRVTDVTYLGYVYGTLAALKHMQPVNRGVIVQVGSALARRSIPLQSAYCAAKHAILGFTDSLRSELMHDKSSVRVTMVELPAVNTPQFRWVRSRLPNKPQPVPPIFEPEVIADALYWAAHNKRREIYLGFPTWKAIIAEKFFPGFADWYLAKTNYQAQQTLEPVEPGRTDNLDKPIPSKASTRGDFVGVSKNFSFAFWLTKNRDPILAGLAGLIAGHFLVRKGLIGSETI